MSEHNTLYKLIILQMLRKVDFSLTWAQISDFLLGNEYTTYFTLRASFSELLEAGMIRQEEISSASNSFYSITDEGRKTIGYFENKIPRAIRDDITQYLEQNRLRLHDAFSVVADYYRNSSGSYNARCIVREKDTPLIDLTLTVPDIAEASAICKQWHEKCQPIYAYLMQQLLSSK